jgi:SAM-dependent methyltransferase
MAGVRLMRFYPYSGLRGQWKTIGQLQFDFLLEHGLRPDHRLLDVGCGTFRLGHLALPYLEEGHYYALDANAAALEHGRRHALAGLMEQSPHIAIVEIGRQFADIAAIFERDAFDYIWMHALLDHLGMNATSIALRSIVPVARDVYATAFLSDDPSAVQWGQDEETAITYPDRDPFHYPREALLTLAREAGLTFAGELEYEHPLGLSMLHFRGSDA